MEKVNPKKQNCFILLIKQALHEFPVRNIPKLSPVFVNKVVGDEEKVQNVCCVCVVSYYFEANYEVDWFKVLD